MSDLASEKTAEPGTAGGSHLAAISRRIVGLIKLHYGKGPTAARTYQSGSLVVVVLTGGFTTVERTLFESGRSDAVSAQRGAFQDAMGPLFRQVIEEELRRPVTAFLSATHQDPDLSAEIFILADGDGLLAEIAQAELGEGEGEIGSAH